MLIYTNPIENCIQITLFLLFVKVTCDIQAVMADFLQRGNNLSTGHSSAAESAGDPLTRAAHTAVAVALGFILVLGFLSNSLVLLVFSRFPRLHMPMNLLLINVSASDMLVSIFRTPLSFAASVRGKWLTGHPGCRWYGFSNALFSRQVKEHQTQVTDDK